MSTIIFIIVLLAFALLIYFATRHTKPTPPPVPPTPPETVDVSVCEETGFLPNIYCPLSVIRTFIKGREPTAVCTAHKRSEQPFLVGTSAYQLTDFALDLIECLFIAICRAGGNLSKWFDSHSWPHDPLRGNLPTGWEHSCPWKRIGWWTDPKFPGWQFPLLELEGDDCWNTEYWDKMFGIFCLLVKYDLTGFKYFLDACSWGPNKADYKRFCWMDCARQNGEHGGQMTGGRYEEQEIDPQGHRRVRFYYRKLINKFFDVAAAAGGPRLLWGIMNEPNYPNPGQTTVEEQERLITSLHKFIHNVLKGHGVADENIVICAGQGFERMRKDPELAGCVFELHGVDSPETMREKLKQWGTRNIILSGDGPDPNARGIEATIGSHTWDPSPAQAVAMRPIMIENKIRAWESFNRSIERGWPADIRRVNTEALRAFCGK